MDVLKKIFGFTLLILLFFIGLTYASVEKKSIDQDQAWKIVMEKILAKEQKDKIVYVSIDLLKSGQAVKSWGHDYKVPEDYQQAWLFFIDDQPGANWEHACRYIFVDAGSGKYTILKARTPPDSMEKLKKIFPLPPVQKKGKC
jgi:hypothetical protein